MAPALTIPLISGVDELLLGNPVESEFGRRCGRAGAERD
jgi:hypothetical protein